VTPGLLRSVLLVLPASVIGSFGAVFLKMGAGSLKIGAGNLAQSLFSFLNPKLALGVALYVASSVLYAMGIAHGELSVLFPIASLGYVWTLIWSRLFFKEPFTSQKLLGIGLILLGVFFVGFGGSQGS
jgi:drug/metabolite transporter (DMT)-like permease